MPTMGDFEFKRHRPSGNREIVINSSPRGGAIELSTLPYRSRRLYLIFISLATPLAQVEGSGAHSPRIWENNTMHIILTAHKQYLVFARVPWTCESQSSYTSIQ
jgi:hypothetical protein